MPKNNRVAFDKVDGFTKDLIQCTVYEFYDQKRAPTVQMIFQKVKEKTKETDYAFPYELTSLKKLLKMIGFHFCKTNNRTVLMEIPPQLGVMNISEKSEGFLPVFIDETWYDTHDVVKKAWSDNSGRCNVSKFISKGKRIVICHAGSEFGFIPNSLLMCGKSLSKAPADYHQDMNSDVFESWLEKQLLSSLPQKCVQLTMQATIAGRKLKYLPRLPKKRKY